MPVFGSSKFRRMRGRWPRPILIPGRVRVSLREYQVHLPKSIYDFYFDNASYRYASSLYLSSYIRNTV